MVGYRSIHKKDALEKGGGCSGYLYGGMLGDVRSYV